MDVTIAQIILIALQLILASAGWLIVTMVKDLKKSIDDLWKANSMTSTRIDNLKDNISRDYVHKNDLDKYIDSYNYRNGIKHQ